jgi:hypothetical protein
MTAGASMSMSASIPTVPGGSQTSTEPLVTQISPVGQRCELSAGAHGAPAGKIGA